MDKLFQTELMVLLVNKQPKQSLIYILVLHKIRRDFNHVMCTLETFTMWKTTRCTSGGEKFRVEESTCLQ